jgi:hypothetical protein
MKCTHSRICTDFGVNSETWTCEKCGDIQVIEKQITKKGAQGAEKQSLDLTPVINELKQRSLFVSDIMQILGIPKSHALLCVKQLKNEGKITKRSQNGKLVISGVFNELSC